MKKLEVIYPKKKAKDHGAVAGNAKGVVMIGSTGGYDDGFLARITLADKIHLQLFPKFGMVAMEVANNGNTNLPAACTTEELLDHLFDAEPQIDPNDEKAMDFNPKKPREKSGPVYAGGLDDWKLSTVPLDRATVVEAIEKLKQVTREKHGAWGLHHRED